MLDIFFKLAIFYKKTSVYLFVAKLPTYGQGLTFL